MLRYSLRIAFLRPRLDFERKCSTRYFVAHNQTRRAYELAVPKYSAHYGCSVMLDRLCGAVVVASSELLVGKTHRTGAATSASSYLESISEFVN